VSQPITRFLLGVIASVALIGNGAARPPTAVAEIFVSAASDLSFVLPELVKAYNQPNLKIQLKFGASATLATQAIRGLQTDIFLSADATQVANLKQAGITASEPFTYAIGHIAIASAMTSELKLDNKLNNVKAFFDQEIAAGRRPKLVIANPAHAPYGIAASQALQALGHSDFFKPHLVLAENVAQTAQYVASGNVSVGIISLSLCKAPVLMKSLRCQELENGSYLPITQTGVLVKNNSPHAQEAAKFLRFLQSEKAKILFQQHGLSPPN
jgi:molybdate transport system substrate-binding protein